MVGEAAMVPPVLYVQSGRRFGAPPDERIASELAPVSCGFCRYIGQSTGGEAASAAAGDASCVPRAPLTTRSTAAATFQAAMRRPVIARTRAPCDRIFVPTGTPTF